MGHRTTLGVCLTSLNQISIQRNLDALCAEASNRDIDLRIYTSFSDLYKVNKKNTAERNIFSQIDYANLDGIIMFSDMIKSVAVRNMIVDSANAACIPIMSLKEPTEGCINLKFNVAKTFHDIITHLYKFHGCRTINFISGNKGNPIADMRLQVYYDTMNELHLPVSDLNVLFGDFWSVPTRNALENFFAAGLPLPNAFVCANDAMALEACNVLKEHGYKIPEDVIVTGMGGISERHYHFPVITTGVYDYSITSQFIFDTFKKIRDGKFVDSDLMLNCGIDFNESCGCLPRSSNFKEQQLVDTYAQLELERGYTYEVQNIISAINDECTLDTIAYSLPWYARKPGIEDFNFYVKTELAIATGLVAYDESLASKPITLLSAFIDGENKLYAKPMTMREMHEQQKVLSKNFVHTLSIPLNSDDEFFGVISFGYKHNHIISALVFELVTTLNTAIDLIAKRFKLDDINMQLNILSEQTIESLAEIVEAKSEFTGLHVKRVSEYTRILAESLGYSQDMVNIIRIASMMHDIGKINIPSSILEKPGKLTTEEFDIIKTHVHEGAKLLRKSPGKIMETACVIALEHHEKWNGTGYLGLKGEDINRESRIVALADVFDALVSVRPYKNAFSAETAYDIIVKDSGLHFDPTVVEAFIANFGKFKIIMQRYADE